MLSMIVKENKMKLAKKEVLGYFGRILCIFSLVAIVLAISSPLGVPESGALLLIAFAGIGILGYLLVLEVNRPEDQQ